MFEFSSSPLNIPAAIADMRRRTWQGLAEPGATWSATDRTAIADRARTVRLGRNAVTVDIPGAARNAVDRLAGTPATTSRDWIDATVAEIGEQAYVEIAGIVARVVAVDTFTRLMGVDPEPFSKPADRPSQPEPPPAKARKGKAWVNMVGFPVPPNVLSLVPSEQLATNLTAETLYMTGAQMEDPDITIDGLHRTQIEVVATTLSHGNECFY